MGIHGAFSFFKTTFRDCIHSVRYLDLNGAVHPVFCPRDGQGSATGKTDAQRAQELFEKLDCIMASVRPRRVLYVALDGAAPLAKMNQQRSRRYRSAAESERSLSSSSGGFDRNAITPGTDFMHWLSQQLRTWIEGKKRPLSDGGDSAWQNLSVVLSDSSVPGEGEHKIMDFIRSQQAAAGYDQNTRHCLVGKDGDFLMLGLAVGAKFFTILRETDERESRGNRHGGGGGGGGNKANRAGAAAAAPSPNLSADSTAAVLVKQLDYYFSDANWTKDEFMQQAADADGYIKMSVLSSFQKLKAAPPKGLGIVPDVLPTFINAAVAEHAPSNFELNAAGDALRRLPVLGGAGGAAGAVSGSSDFELVHLHEIRASIVNKYLAPAFAESGAAGGSAVIDDAMVTQVIHDWIVLWFLVGNDFLPHLPSVTLDDGGTKKEFEGILKWHIESLRSDRHLTTGDSLNVPALLSLLRKLAEDEAATFQRYYKGHHASMRFGDPLKPETKVDRVQLHLPGYNDRYWTAKFGRSDAEFRALVCQQYIDGFDWVLKYYLRGVPAWDWFFPFHFAPLASDFLAVSAALRPPTPFLIRGAPLPPLHQLLAVTPPKSRLLLPPAFRSAMQHPRNVALFPTSVDVDMNGCSEMQAHKAVALVPFMDMSALALLFDQCAADLDPGSLSRNQFGRILIFTARGHAHGLLGIAEAPTATSHPGVVCHAA